MKISQVIVRKTFTEGSLKAILSIVIEDVFTLHDIKVIFANGREFVAMPSRLDENGKYRDIAHPITCECRDRLERYLLEAYHNQIDSFEI